MARRMAVAAATVNRVVSCGRKGGRSSTENHSPLPAGDNHCLPSRPRPRGCDSANTTTPSGAPSRASFSIVSLVEAGFLEHLNVPPNHTVCRQPRQRDHPRAARPARRSTGTPGADWPRFRIPTDRNSSTLPHTAARVTPSSRDSSEPDTQPPLGSPQRLQDLHVQIHGRDLSRV